MEYKDLIFKIPIEMLDYEECSKFVIEKIEQIIKDAIDTENNKIVINTNLKLGLPMENINKIAGPFVEAWAYETFNSVNSQIGNKYLLINVESQQRLNMADIVLQFKRNDKSITGSVDVKATAEDIISSGKSPNITSFSRIRTAYIEDPDYMFIILSLKHKVYSQKNSKTLLMDGVMEVVNYNAYDLKYISSSDISYNPALGTGQIQIRDIHYVSYEKRTTWEFCQLLDAKYLKSAKRTFDDWYKEAKKYKWVKE
ncbi:MAG: Type-2 restriction enzyme HpaI [Candidatus Dichloromethanomonas elyunquensis]|nr:MAG: Type-2 restriction enzyme HpaI [Candidatus Dichloromethanomonas elyunquensis]